MTPQDLENKIGFQIGFLIHSGKDLFQTIQDLKSIAENYAKEYAKEELKDLLDSGCYPEYLPKKIEEAIFNIDNPTTI